MFSQGQIAELAGDDPTALLGEIDRAAGVGASRAKMGEAVAAFNASRSRIRELDSKLYAGEDTITLKLSDVERKLVRFEKSGHTAILTEYRNRQRQRQVLDGQFKVVEEALKRLEETSDEIPNDGLPGDLFDQLQEEDREVIALMNSLGASLERAVQESREVALRLRSSIELHRNAMSTGKWEAAAKKATESYKGLVKELESEGVTDPDGYSTLVKEKQRLDGEMNKLNLDKQERKRMVEDSTERLEEVWNARHAITTARRKFLSSALAQNNFVRIEIRPLGDDPVVIERSLRRTLNAIDDRFTDDIYGTSDASSSKGIVPELIKKLPEDPSVRTLEIKPRLMKLKERLKNACAGQGDFGGHFNNYLEREFNRGPELLDNLLTWFPEDGLSVRYSRTGDGTDFQPISQASAGQRSAAMLAFLLAHGEEPLVLDQPEDDLDNQLIYDLVVRQIRENKSRRQIIVVTHNPNIVVNGDAEMTHTMAFVGGQCVVNQSGSLQELAIREEICQVMEGGREAFESRYRRLVWPTI